MVGVLEPPGDTVLTSSCVERFVGGGAESVKAARECRTPYRAWWGSVGRGGIVWEGAVGEKIVVGVTFECGLVDRAVDGCEGIQ